MLYGCIGAFYHLDAAMRDTAVKECLRMLKKAGILVFSYINLFADVYLWLGERLENLAQLLKRDLEGVFNHTSPNEMNGLANRFHLKTRCHLTLEGIAYLHGAKINSASEADFQRYMELYLQTCERSSMLEYGMNGLLIATRTD